MITKCKKHNLEMDFDSSLMNNWYCPICEGKQKQSRLLEVKQGEIIVKFEYIQAVIDWTEKQYAFMNKMELIKKLEELKNGK